MDKQKLERYKPLKRELLMIDKQISKLEERREELQVVVGKVQSSDHEFPYTERRVGVQMFEPKEADKIDREIVRKRARKRQIEEEMNGIESFINAMPEGETKRIFELYYIEGMTQNQVAEIVSLDRSRISRKIHNYIENAHKAQKNYDIIKIERV